jgi:hypothetical protein
MVDSDAITALAVFPAVAAIAWAGAYAWVQWLRHRHDPPSPTAGAPSTAEAARLARLEAGLDALTLEVERLAEGQRYTVRLLEERLPRTLPGAARVEALPSGRVITPH